MSQNKKKMFISLTNIMLLLLLAIGGTFAIFTSEASQIVDFKAGVVQLGTSLDNLKTYSYPDNDILVDEPYTSVNDSTYGTVYPFVNGGFAYVADLGTADEKVSVNGMTPGDVLAFTLNINNESNVNVKYRVNISAVDNTDGDSYNLSDVLLVAAYADGDSSVEWTSLASSNYVTEWAGLAGGETVDPQQYAVMMPFDTSNDYQGQSMTIVIVVEAIQANAFHTVRFFNHESDTIPVYEASVPYGWDVEYLGAEPTYGIVAGFDVSDYYKFLGWRKVGSTEVVSDVLTVTEDADYVAEFEQFIDTRLRFDLVDYSSYSARSNAYYTVSIDQEYNKDYFLSTGNTEISGIPATFKGLPVLALSDYQDYSNDFDLVSENYITSIDFEGSEIKCISDNGIVGFTELTSVELSPSFEYIQQGLFYGLEVESLTVPYLPSNGSSNQTLGYLFADPTQPYHNDNSSVPASLKTVVLSEGNTEVPANAFYNCKNIETIVLPESLEEIKECAFAGCTNLKTLVVPENVTTIGQAILMGCESLENLTLPFIGNTASNPSISPEGTLGYLFGYDNCPYFESEYSDNLAAVRYTYDVAASATFYCYMPESIENLTITGGKLNAGALDGWTTVIENLYIDTDVELEVGSILFTGANREYSYGANANSVENVYYNGSIEDLLAMEHEYKQQNFNASNLWGEPNLRELTSNPMVYAKNFYYLDENGEYVSIEHLVIPEGVTTIGDNAFYRCVNIKSVTLPSTLESIGTDAFSECKNILTVYNASSLDIVAGSSEHGYVAYYALEVLAPGEESQIIVHGDYLFKEENGTYYLTTYVGNDKDLVLPDSFGDVQSYVIAEGVFKGMSIRSAYLPEAVTAIEAMAFSQCSSAQYYIIQGNIESIAFNSFAMTTVTIYFNGTVEKWEELQANNGNDGSWGMSSVNPSFYSQNTPDDDSYSYWHYEGNTPVQW